MRRKEEGGSGPSTPSKASGAGPKTPARKKAAAAKTGSGTKRKPVSLSDDEEDVKPARVKKMKEEVDDKVKKEEESDDG